MPSACPDRGRCGVYFPGWLDGDPPTAKHEEKTMQVHFHKNNNCKVDSKYIQVKNCGAYTIYRLIPTTSCLFRYCGTD